MKRALKWTVIVCCAVFLSWQAYQYNHRLNFVPDEMHVWRILFANEESWGFGPGGAETGFIMYALPDEIAEKVRLKGVAYLSSFPSARIGNGLQGKYEEWYETPVSGSRGVPFYEKGPECGYCIDIDPNAEESFKKALSKPGSFYAYGRVGMILVAPAIHKIFYIYAG